jgi:hypothetical protein
MGVAQPNDLVEDPSGYTIEGIPIFERPLGHSFTLVIEAKRGPNNRSPGSVTFNYDPFNPSVRPDLEVVVSRPLGDGSTAVCDDHLPLIGGIPAAPTFDVTQAISNAINDLGCRFLDGSGQPGGRTKSEEACTQFSDGLFHFVAQDTRVQFCAAIAAPFAFPTGDTVVMARARDSLGQAGPPASIVIRVLP